MKKYTVVVQSSADAEYRAMVIASCELILLNQLMKELGHPTQKSVPLHYAIKLPLILHRVMSFMRGPNT